jgi:excisionase family DNA binding protein
LLTKRCIYRILFDMQSDNAVIPALCSVAEAAELLGSTPSTVQRWAKNGRLTVHQKLPGKTGAYLLDRDEVESMKPAAN